MTQEITGVVGLSNYFEDIDFFRTQHKAVEYIERADEWDKFYSFDGALLNLEPQKPRPFGFYQPAFRLIVAPQHDLDQSRAELRLALVKYLIQHPQQGMASEATFAIPLPELIAAVIRIRGYTA